MAAFSESMALGQALGLSQPVLLDFLLGSPAVPGIVTGKRARLEADAFGDADFPLHGCARICNWPPQTAYEQDVAMPMVNTAKEIYALAIRYGLGEEDFSAIYRFLNTSKHPSE